MRNEPERVDGYLAALPDDRRRIVERLRATIRATAPDAHEGIAYQMPAFYVGDRFLVSYAAFKHHLSLFPASEGVVEHLGRELDGNVSGQGTIRFTVDEPLSDEVIREIVRIRLLEVAVAADQPA